MTSQTLLQRRHLPISMRQSRSLDSSRVWLSFLLLIHLIAHRSHSKVVRRSYRVAATVKNILQKYKELQDVIAILGMDELSEERQDHRLPCQENPEIPRSELLRRRAIHRTSWCLPPAEKNRWKALPPSSMEVLMISRKNSFICQLISTMSARDLSSLRNNHVLFLHIPHTF